MFQLHWVLCCARFGTRTAASRLLLRLIQLRSCHQSNHPQLQNPTKPAPWPAKVPNRSCYARTSAGKSMLTHSSVLLQSPFQQTTLWIFTQRLQGLSFLAMWMWVTRQKKRPYINSELANAGKTIMKAAKLTIQEPRHNKSQVAAVIIAAAANSRCCDFAEQPRSITRTSSGFKAQGKLPNSGSKLPCFNTSPIAPQ